MKKEIKFYKRLRDLRIDHDYTQTEVANVLEISQRYYSDIENGKRKLAVEHLEKLSILYKVSCDYILEMSNEK